MAFNYDTLLAPKADIKKPSFDYESLLSTPAPAKKEVTPKTQQFIGPIANTQIKTLKTPGTIGGSYFSVPGKPNELVKKERTTYGGYDTKSGYERDDIVPVAIGGVNTEKKNIRYEPLLPSPRQPGRLTESDVYFDEHVIDQYKRGEIGLQEARLKVLAFKQAQELEKEGIKQGVVANLPQAITDTLVGGAKGIFDMFTSGTQAMGKNIGNAIYNYDPASNKMRNEAIDYTNQSFDMLMQAARKEKDPAKKKRLLISATKVADSTGVDVFSNPEFKKTTAEVYGDAAIMAMEILPWGSYSKEGLIGGKAFTSGLTKAVPSAVAGMSGKSLAQLPLKEAEKQIIKQSAIQSVKTGLPIGMGYGLGHALQQDKDAKGILQQTLTEGAIGAISSFGLGVVSRNIGMASAKIGNILPKKAALPTDVPAAVKQPGPVVENPKDPTIQYVSAKSLGKDAKGNAVLARTEVDYKTGKATIYYDQALKKDPGLLEDTLNHENGHVLDKRLGGGTNLSAQVSAYGPNKTVLDGVLDDFSTQQGKSNEEIAASLNNEITHIGNGDTQAEKFADVVRLYKKNPAEMRKYAPTLTSLLEYKPDSSIGTHVVTKSSMLEESLAQPPTKTEQEAISGVVEGVKSKAATDSLKLTQERVKASAAMDIQGMLKSGDIDRSDIYVGNSNVLNPDFAKGRIDDIAMKLDMYQKGLGDKFRSQVDPTKVTMKGNVPEDLVQQALALLPEDGAPAVRGKSGIIATTGLKTDRPGVSAPTFNPDTVNAPDDVKTLLEATGASSDNFSSQRISKGNKDIVELAHMTGLTENQLIKAKPGSLANAETITRARQLVLDKSQDLYNFVKGIDPANLTPDEAQTLKDKWTTLVGMQRAVSGFRTEASHAFRSLGIELTPGENASVADLADILKKAGVASKGDMALFTKEIAKPPSSIPKALYDAYLNTWYSAVLSGPSTWAKNVGSTAASTVEDYASIVTSKDIRYLPQATSGLIRGFVQGVKEIPAIMKGEIPANSKYTDLLQDRGRLGADTANETVNKVLDSWGRFTEMVPKLLSSQDRPFVRANTEMERSILDAKYPDMADDVSSALSKAYGEYVAYHGEPRALSVLGATGNPLGGMREGINKLSQKFPPTRLIVPFVNIVANVSDRQLDFMPIASAMRLPEAALKEQAAKIISEYGLSQSAAPVIIERLKDQQLGRVALGTAIAGAAVALAAKGKISGSGPSNYNEKKQLQDAGWRPNSIDVPGVGWVPWQYLGGPAAGIFAMAGNIHDSTKYDQAPSKTVQDLVMKGMIGWVRSEKDMSFVRGVSDLFDVIDGRKNYEDYAKDWMVGRVPVPAFISQTKGMVMPNMYDTTTVGEALKEKIGITEGLEPNLNAFGQQLKRDILPGIVPVQKKQDPVIDMLNQHQLVVSKPGKNTLYAIPGKKTKRAMTPKEYTQYIKESGQEIYDTLNHRLSQLDGMSDDDREKTVQNIVTKARKKAKDKIIR